MRLRFAFLEAQRHCRRRRQIAQMRGSLLENDAAAPGSQPVSVLRPRLCRSRRRRREGTVAVDAAGEAARALGGARVRSALPQAGTLAWYAPAPFAAAFRRWRTRG